MGAPSSDEKALFIRAVKRAFADALLREFGRSALMRQDVAKSAGITRACLHTLLAAKRQSSISTLISLAASLGTRPEILIAKTMENLGRIQRASTPVIHTTSITDEETFPPSSPL